MTTFTAIDVETANADRASICQIGIVQVKDDQIESEWATIVDPEDWFDSRNVSIHGIGENDVRTKPTLPDIETDLRRLMEDSILVSHSPFDRTAIGRALERYNLPPLEAIWLDSVKIARRAWPDWKSHRLSAVAAALGISLNHHDALSDARAAATIVLRACQETGLSVADWILESQRPSGHTTMAQAREANVEGLLFGETIAFTGALVHSLGEKQQI